MTEQDPPPPSPRPQGKRGRSAGASAWTGPPTAAKRPVSRRVLVAVCAVPVLAFLVYHLVLALSGAGNVEVGETVTDRSGVGLNVSAPQQYTAGGPQAATDEKIYQVIVAVNNPTSQALSTSDVAITATVNGNAVEAVPLDEPIVQNIEPNMQLNVPFRFRVKNGTTGPLQVTVQNGTGKPVYFTSTIQ